MSKTYVSKVLEVCENGDCIIEFPDDMMEELGWEVGDVLQYDVVDGCIILKNSRLMKGDSHE